MKPALFLGCLMVAGSVSGSLAVFETLGAIFGSKGELNNRCPPGDIRCADGRCILKKWRCDGQKDCRDGSDELNCPKTTCNSDQHHCDTTKCIPLQWRCDGRKDCEDGSDELSSTCTQYAQCPKNFWKCPIGQMCIPLHWKCDGEKDCKQGEDEDRELCSKSKGCFKEEKLCANQQECVAESMWCDGKADCRDRSDEENDACHGRSTTPSPSCSFSEFKCANSGICIPGKWVCDGTQDCSEGEDEKVSDGCLKKTGGGYVAAPEQSNSSAGHGFSACKNGDFTCGNGECIPASWRCDGGLDCEDGSDERICDKSGGLPFTSGPEPPILRYEFVAVSTCKSNEFFCILTNGSGGCLELDKVCNHYMDCRNGTDEDIGCITACTKDNGQCSDKCLPTPAGPQCSCSKGYELSSDGKACDDINECEPVGASPGGPCSHSCINTRGSYRCTCATGFSLELNGHICKPEDPMPLLAYAAERQIRWMSMDGNHQGELAKVGKENMMVGLEWSQPNDSDSSTLFYSDAEKRQIIRIDSVTHQHTVLMEDLLLPEGIAFDWVNQNLYYIDAETPEIGVCAVSTSIAYCSRIIHVELQNPRGIAVHPGKRLLFFAQWGKDGKIERTWLDGSGRQEVISYKVVWPNALTVDYIHDRLYWIDARLDWIESCTYAGEDRRTVLHLQTAHPFSLAILGNRLYWTDWSYDAVHSVLTSGTDFKVIHKTHGRPMSIISIHDSRRPHFESPCTPGQNPCEQICVAKPGMHTCLCQKRYHLVDGYKCLIWNPEAGVKQELKSSEKGYSASTVAGIICACILALILVVVVVVYSRKYFMGMMTDSLDEKTLLEYEIDSPRMKPRHQTSIASITSGSGSPNPCYENFPPPSYVVKFHKNRSGNQPDAFDSPMCDA